MTKTKRLLIDLDIFTEKKLQDLAKHHNQKLKPFIEYLCRLQVGMQKPPTVKPLDLSPESVAEMEQRAIEAYLEPTTSNPRAWTPGAPVEWTEEKCNHLTTYVGGDNFQRCQACNQIVD